MAILDINKDLAALFSDQVQKTPDAIALEDEKKIYTYLELDAKVDALAQRFRLYGVSRDDLVGVLLPRSADYVIACLAALRAGGAFLVLELAYPPDLLGDVIEDARPLLIATHTAHAGHIREGIPLVLLNEIQTPVNGLQLSNLGPKEPGPLPSSNDLERLAFVSYSSGTTGKPKGIANPHRAPVLSYDLRFRVSDLQPGDRVACNVFFIWEILRPLLRGATVVAVPDEASYDPVALEQFLSTKKITETLMTPTLLAAVLALHAEGGVNLPSLKTLWLNGEVVTTDLARRAMKVLPKTRLLNCYSASETHEIACGDIARMLNDASSYCPVGPPIDPEHIYILDENGNRVDHGLSGELFVGGELLARGYLNLPDTTAKAFIPDPFSKVPGARMYATGDMARILPSGDLEITGRIKGMIKIRGYSIVPGKVENTIVEQMAVSHCAVVAHGEGLERQLVAYIVRDKDASSDRIAPSIDESCYSPSARQKLSASLAHYMIPTLWVELDVLPTHGVSAKVDLRRLHPPKPCKRHLSTFAAGAPGRGSKLNIDTIAQLWAASLKTPPGVVTPEHDFFSLGGHSLILADVASRMTKTFGFPVPLLGLAQHPTLEGHLGVVRAARDGHTAAVQADLPGILKADSQLPDDIKFKPTKATPLNRARTVLLTGTTGFLGAFLLKDILDNSSATVICLVRFNELEGNNVSAGFARLRKNLLDLGLWHDMMLDRIELLPGNLARERFGLSAEDFEKLASRVDVIVHSAATVNLVYPYALLRDANVGGTREILRLASQSGATLQYISTNGVLPPSSEGWSEETILDLQTVVEKIHDGYGQTKWVAEKLVLDAGKQGLPVKIYRPGTISGHSISGAENVYDLLTALIVESLNIGYAPDIDGWRFEMAPADYVSKAIVTLASDTRTDQQLFHLGESNPISARDLFSHLGDLGYPTQKLGWQQWVELWTDKRGSIRKSDHTTTVDILRGGMPTAEYLKNIIVINDEATAFALKQDNIVRPSIDAKLLQIYARHWYVRGWLPRAPQSSITQEVSLPVRRRAGKLNGKVAVVTGASSGIGAAVAAALAREGAHVALAARRVDALEALKTSISTNGTKIISHKTDVTNKEQVESLIQTATEQLGPIDILVSCAGVMYFTMMKNVQVDDWDRTVDVNCKGLLHCLSSTIPSMLARSTGHIVAISSDAGRKVFPGLGVYSASKFFVEATLQSLRLETAGSGLRVTSVQPGNVSTDLLGMSTDQEALTKYGEPSGAKVLDAEDIAEAVLYAVSQPAHVAVNEVLIEPRDEPI